MVLVLFPLFAGSQIDQSARNFPRRLSDGIKMKTRLPCASNTRWQNQHTIPRENQTLKRYTHPSVPFSTIHNRQDTEATYMSMSRARGKEDVVLIPREAFSGIKREQGNTSSTVDATRDDHPRQNTSEWENKHDTVSFVCGIWSTTQKSLPMRQKWLTAVGNRPVAASGEEAGVSRCKLLYTEWINKSYRTAQRTVLSIYDEL